MSEIEELENQVCNAIAERVVMRDAARAMLAALKELRANAGKYQRGQIWQVAHDAISAAEAAGITVYW